MNKFKIHSIENQEGFTVISLRKTASFFLVLTKVLKESLNITDAELEDHFDKKDMYRLRKKHIGRYVDRHEAWCGDNFRLDLFYGKKIVFLAFKASDRTRLKFMKLLSENSVWIKKKEKKET